MVYKSQKALSETAIDQAHEQNNAQVKGCGGASSLTENSSAFRHCMTAGPEVGQMLCEFEEKFNLNHCKTTLHPHEQKKLC